MSLIWIGLGLWTEPRAFFCLFSFDDLFFQFNLKKELFSDVGPIKRARFLEKGLAEVIYVKLEHAKEAIYKYDKNELDG